jgi:hypothetical protein
VSSGQEGARSVRARASPYLVVAALAVSLAPVATRQRGAAPAVPAPPPPGPAPISALLSASEIVVNESGGIAGRVHAARLVAADGRVEVEYRPREALGSAPPFGGTLESDRYVALWRELETARIWEIRSPRPGGGADLVNVEVRIRLGESGRVVRWDEAGGQTPEIRVLAEIAGRVLAAGRAAAFAR